MVPFLKTLYFSSCVIFVTGLPCSLKYGIDISDGEILENGDIVKNGITYTEENYKKVNGYTIGCICNIKVCIRKCCPLGEYMLNRTCAPSKNSFVMPKHNLSSYHLLYGNKCKRRQIRSLIDPFYEEEEFFVEEDGRLHFLEENLYFTTNQYCVDYVEDENYTKALICEYKNADISDANLIGIIVSMPFLLLTFIVYAILNDRNIHIKCLMCYVSTLFGAYLLMSAVQLYPKNIDFGVCETIAMLSFFFFMVSFFFLNVMSIDMWWTFSGLRGFSGSKKESEIKRFLLYSAYAWGTPILLVIIVISLQHSTTIPEDAWYHPGIADGSCWFREKYPTLLYFYGPVTIILITNFTLFCITAWKIRRIQQDTEMLRTSESKKHAYENDKEKFNLFLKLMLAMGVNWTLEIISWLIDWQVANVPDEIWYISDFCNALYGMFIFFMFVFKKSVWKLLKKRYYVLTGQSHLIRNMTHQQNFDMPSSSVHMKSPIVKNANNVHGDELKLTNASS